MTNRPAPPFDATLVGKTAEMLGESKPGPRSAPWAAQDRWIPPAAA
jgi:hypothetical protein